MNQFNELNEKMIKYKNECGCKMGAQFMTGASAISMFISICLYGFTSISFLSHLPFMLIFIISAAVAGKLLAIFYSRYKYKQLKKQLESIV